MINGAHVILYSQDAEADRAFIRDVFAFPGVDAGGGWLIFELLPAGIAVHPTEGAPQHEFCLSARTSTPSSGNCVRGASRSPARSANSAGAG